MAWFQIEESRRSFCDEAELIALTAPSMSCSLEDLRSALHQGSSEDDQEEDSVDQSDEDQEEDSEDQSGENLDEESGPSPDEHIDALVADAAEEINDRIATIGNGYPFSFDGSIITASTDWDKDALAYVFLLLVSAEGLPGLRTGRRHFEQVVTAALAQYLQGESLRFGFPHRTPVPSHPNEAVNYLAERIGQRRIFTRQVKPSEKDLGVDAVAWKRFADSQPTKVVLLANCSTGANWKSKLGELNLDKWKRMIDFGCDPVRTFAVPWILSQGEWGDIVDFGNMVVDRSRTASLLVGWNSTKEIKTWCDRRLKDATSA